MYIFFSISKQHFLNWISKLNSECLHQRLVDHVRNVNASHKVPWNPHLSIYNINIEIYFYHFLGDNFFTTRIKHSVSQGSIYIQVTLNRLSRSYLCYRNIYWLIHIYKTRKGGHEFERIKRVNGRVYREERL